MHDGRQMGVAIVEDVGARRVEEGRAQRIDALAAADHRRLRPPENWASDLSAISTGSVRQPASATAKKFSSARLASWRAAFGDVLPARVDDEAGESFGGSRSGLHGPINGAHQQRCHIPRRPDSRGEISAL